MITKETLLIPGLTNLYYFNSYNQLVTSIVTYVEDRYFGIMESVEYDLISIKNKQDTNYLKRASRCISFIEDEYSNKMLHMSIEEAYQYKINTLIDSILIFPKTLNPSYVSSSFFSSTISTATSVSVGFSLLFFLEYGII